MRGKSSRGSGPIAGKQKIKDGAGGSERGVPPVSSLGPFLDLGLSEKAARGAAGAGYALPTEIQRETVPPVGQGKDVIACSETGSGKTAAFALPIIDLIDHDLKAIQVLVLVPTRELCRQVAAEFRRLDADGSLKVAEIYGGVGYAGQRKMIREGAQVVVGAPGRVLDLLQSRDLDFSRLKIFVLDEADRMLDMGFSPQIRAIIKYVPDKRQTLMFSATIPPEVTKLAKVCMADPVRIQVGVRARPPSQLVQEALDVLPAEKEARLLELVEQEPGSVLIFTATKVRADDLYRVMKRAGHNVCVLHSDRAQRKRQEAIDGFRSGKFRIMVATDVASRGLDIVDISLVINYDLPENPEDYVHRIGRTGRAEAVGRAVSFVTYKNYHTLRLIEKLTGKSFKNLAPARRSLDRRATLKRRVR